MTTEAVPVISLALIAKVKGQNISKEIRKNSLFNKTVSGGMIILFLSKLFFADLFKNIIASIPFLRK